MYQIKKDILRIYEMRPGGWRASDWLMIPLHLISKRYDGVCRNGCRYTQGGRWCYPRTADHVYYLFVLRR